MQLELIFPIHLRGTLKNVVKMSGLEEIRVRIEKPLFIYIGQKEYVLVQSDRAAGGMEIVDSRQPNGYENAYRITEKDLLEMQNYISNYSLYAWQEELRNGFLTIQGGHRIGLAGGTTNHVGHINGISYITFFNIRVAHERIGCADKILSYLYETANTQAKHSIHSEIRQMQKTNMRIYNTLIISPPGAGKTTLLRDCIRSLSYGVEKTALNLLYHQKKLEEATFVRGVKIGLVDERSEIAACYHGIPQNDIGPRTDVLDGCNKPEGIQILLRVMSPEVIAVDELGTEEDFKAIEQAAYSGCKVLGTVHAGSMKELQEKPILKKWCEKELFERFIFIEKGEDGMRNFKVYNNRWELLC